MLHNNSPQRQSREDRSTHPFVRGPGGLAIHARTLGAACLAVQYLAISATTTIDRARTVIHEDEILEFIDARERFHG